MFKRAQPAEPSVNKGENHQLITCRASPPLAEEGTKLRSSYRRAPPPHLSYLGMQDTRHGTGGVGVAPLTILTDVLEAISTEAKDE